MLKEKEILLDLSFIGGLKTNNMLYSIKNEDSITLDGIEIVGKIYSSGSGWRGKNKRYSFSIIYKPQFFSFEKPSRTFFFDDEKIAIEEREKLIKAVNENTY